MLAGTASLVVAEAAAPGQVLWTFMTGGEVWSSPAIGADGTVYVGSRDQKVYALSSTSVGGLANSPWPKFRADAQNTGCLDQPPRVRSPKFTALKEGSEGRIAVEVVGKPVPTVQWFHNGQPVPEGTNAVLTLPEVNRALEGTYQLVATNVAGTATSVPIVAVVSNVDPQGYPAWRWESAGEGLVVEESPLVTGPWAESVPLPPSAHPGLYVGTNALASPRFCRLRGAAASRFTTSFVASGWWYHDPAGTRHRIEYVWSGSGWTNWVPLTELTLSESPHLFEDAETFDHPDAVYRTTPMP